MKKSKAPSGAIRPFGWSDKIGYALGDMGCNFSFQLVSTFMQLFYMQYIGIPTEAYEAIIIISKVFDAINDIIIGNLVDTKKIGKKSKYMPWILLGAIGIVFFTVMIFAPVKGFSLWGKYAWCLGSYCLWSIAYTMVNVPYGSLHSVITDDPQQKVTLSTFRSIGAALPGILVMMVLPDIVYVAGTKEQETPELKGEILLPIALIFSIFALVVLFATTKLVKERVIHNSSENAIGFKSILSSTKSFFTNRAMVGVTIATVASVALFNSTMSLNNMVFQYFFEDTAKMKFAMVGSYLPMVVFMAFLGKLTKKFGKKNLIVGSMLVGVISGVVSFLLPITPDSKGMLLYVICLMGLNVGNAGFQISVWAMVSDCIQVNYLKTGKSEEGSLYAIYSFFRKLAQGIGQALVARGLSMIGFVEGSNAVQPDTFGEDVKTLYFIVLAAGSLIAFLAMKFIYNIGKKEEQKFAERAGSC